MTKIFQGLLVSALLFTGIASAGSITVGCGGATQASTSASSSPTLTGTANNCTAFTIPAGFTLTDIMIKFQTSVQGYDSTQTDTINFTNTVGGALTSSVIGDSLTSPVGAGSDNGATLGTFTGAATCSNTPAGSTIILCDWTGLNATGVFGAITDAISATWSTGGIIINGNGTGSEADFVTAIYNYVPTGVTPEPSTLLMIGGSLIGLALAGRRKFRA